MLIHTTNKADLKMVIEQENVKHIIEIRNFTQPEAIEQIVIMSPKDRKMASIINTACVQILNSEQKQDVIEIAECLARNIKKRVMTPEGTTNLELFFQSILATLEFFIDAELIAIQRQKQISE